MNRIFSLYLLALGLWSFCSFIWHADFPGIGDPRWLQASVFFGISYVPILCHFAVTFLGLDTKKIFRVGLWAMYGLLLVVLTFVVYIPAFSYDFTQHEGFVWDDDSHFIRDQLVHADDGMDELSTTDFTVISELRDGEVSTCTASPEDFGLERAKIDDLLVDSPEQSAEMIRGVLAGQPGPARDIALLNAAACS